ncbi:MAG: hypothetical protein ACQEP5_04510 [Actinomycetota bacterium]
MILLVILSAIFIWVNASSLRFIIAAGHNKTIIEDAEKLETALPRQEKNFSYSSGPVLFSLGLIIFLNLVQIGYFVICAYMFNNMFVTIGSSVLVGYTIYSIIQFLPRVKDFFKKPIEYLKSKTQGFEKGINLVMTSVEIVFCSYILVKILIKYRIFG